MSGALAGWGKPALLALVLLAIGAGAAGSCDWFYYRQAREVRRRAEAIEGLEVLDVDGNHDVTLEDIWLDARYRGEPLYFMNVTPDSFEDVAHLHVGQVGEWSFTVEEFEAGKTAPAYYDIQDRNPAVRHFSTGGCLDFGPRGDVGAGLDPPIRSIPEFLRRLPEVREIVRRLPETPPGARIGEGVAVRMRAATRETRRTPTWIWAWRERTEEASAPVEEDR